MAMTHTAEEVRTLRVKLKSGDYDGVDLMHAWIALDAYAALLERSEAEVTNSVVNAALKEFRRWADSEDTVAMDAALHLVWPMPLSGRAEAKLSERKTVHEWLDDLHIEREEFGKPLCLLRRLRILCDRYRETCDQLSLELGKQIGWPVAAEPAKAGVTDFVRDCAITAFNLHPGPGEPLNVKEHGESMRAALLAVWPVAAEPAQEVPVAYLAKNANEAFLFFADDHEGLDAYTADGFSITPLVRHSTPEASCGDCPTRDYKAAEPARPADSGRVGDENGAATLRRLGDNAAKWAAEFRATALRLGYSDMDEGWLIGWFANAIEHSSDIRRWRTEAALAAQGQPAERDEIAEEAWRAFYRAADKVQKESQSNG